MGKGINKVFNSNLRRFQQEFRRHPNSVFAFRITVSIGLLTIPFVIAGMPFFGITLSMGAVAGALSETDDHPKGRIKSLTITIISFFISSIAVGLLNAFPWLLGAGFVLSTVVFILLGGIDDRYRAITFGSVLVGIYAMLGIGISPAWYWQAVLLPAGALFHGLLTLLLLYRKPLRLLDLQIAEGFRALAAYLDKKAMLFPSREEDQASINKDLALLNINVVNALEKIVIVLNNYEREMNKPELLRPYLQRFMTLQSLHERAASSHERHDRLSANKAQVEVMEGFGEMLRQLAYACRLAADNILSGVEYRHPPVLEWISQAISDKLQQMDPVISQPLVLLQHNLYRSHLSLKYLDDPVEGTAIPRLKKDERSTLVRFKSLLSIQHPRMRYAIRLSLTFALGYALVIILHLHKGAWVMLTSLLVSQITYSDTRRKLFERLEGTIAGVVVGALLVQIFTTIASQFILMLVSVWAFFYWVKSHYSVAVIFITIFVLSAFSIISNDGGLAIMLPRLVDTLLGASLSFLTIRFLWPGWQYRRMPGLISKAMEKNRIYLKAIAKEYKKASPDDLNYRIARREAHLADNELALAWNSMRQEPKSKQLLMKHAFTFTYLNHALLSHISALGAHRETNLPGIGNIENVITQIEKALNAASNYFSGNKDSIPDDFTPVLDQLRQQIVIIGPGLKKQQLRLFYNIAATTAKIMDELDETRSDLLKKNG